MKNKNVTRYYTYFPRNEYNFGGDIVKGITSMGGSAGLNGGANMIANVTGGLINSNGFSTGVGDAMNKIGSLASNIPGVGGLIGAGVNLLGSVVNAGFGSKLNTEAIKGIQNNTLNQASVNSNATNNNALLGDLANLSILQNVKKSDVGKDGWFVNKAGKKTAELNNNINNANLTAYGNLENRANNIADYAALNQASSFFEEGGSTNGANFTNGLTFFNVGGQHEENPYGGILIGIDEKGTPNLVEEGEVRYKDYIFSNSLKAKKKDLEKVNLNQIFDKKTFADIAKNLSKESDERPNDPISKRGLEDSMMKLISLQEMEKAKKESIKQKNIFKDGGRMNYLRSMYNIFDGTDQSFVEISKNTLRANPLFQNDPYLLPVPNATLDIPKIDIKSLALQNIAKQRSAQMGNNFIVTDAGSNLKKVSPDTNVNANGKQRASINSGSTYLRYAPVLGAGLGVFSDAMGWTNKPNYTNAEIVANAANGIGDIQAQKVGNYMGYNPFDINYETSKLQALSAANARALMDSAGGNRANAQAGLIALNYGTNQGLGNLARQAQEYNLNQRHMITEFNRGTDMFNAESQLKADMTNKQKDELKFKAALAAADMRDRQDLMAAQGRSANLTNLFDSLGDIGRENFSKNMIISNPASYYKIGEDGKISYKNSYDSLNKEQQEYVKWKAEQEKNSKTKSNSNKYGGYLTIKSKRR